MNVFSNLLKEAKLFHETHDALRLFIEFPLEIKPQQIKPHFIPAANLMLGDKGLDLCYYKSFRDAIIDAAPYVIWRETYKDTNIGSDFMDKFACYEVIGKDAPFTCSSMRSFILYQPANFYYPWHHHPAEEIYIVLAGEAEFFLEGDSSKILKSGDFAFHPANYSHALKTLDQPILAYVVWRSDFDIPPVWSLNS